MTYSRTFYVSARSYHHGYENLSPAQYEKRKKDKCQNCILDCPHEAFCKCDSTCMDGCCACCCFHFGIGDAEKVRRLKRVA